MPRFTAASLGCGAACGRPFARSGTGTGYRDKEETMRVKEILILAADLACRRDLADYLAGKNGEDASARAREEEMLLRCYNLAENEIALDYLPLRREECFESDGCVPYAAFAEPPVEILSVRDETGRSLRFAAGEKGVRVREGRAVIRYSVRPRVKGPGDRPELSEKGDARLLALGTACEYALMSGNYDAASLLDRRYRDALACACRERGGRLRMRRWV